MNNGTSKSKILIVDDEPANIFVLEGLLTENNYIVLSAQNGNQALNLIKSELPDLVLLDIMMPEISGIDVLKSILNDSSTSDLPVLMVSAKSEAEDIENALNLGAVDYIPKPFNDIELLARVRAALRLKHYTDRLKEMVNSKNNFIRIVSHDLRTPFSAISGFANILLQDEELLKTMTSSHKEFLQHILDTSRYLISYFNKLLNWSKLESSAIELTISQVFLKKMIDTTQIVFQNDIIKKKINFYRNFPEDLTINVDETFFNQVINNLISNAVKYTSEGGSICIKGFNEGGKTIIEISDTGEGIQGITPEELFNRPYHISKTGTSNETGTGVGLFICKKIIDAHGFSISFRSTQGMGTTFIIIC